MSIMDNIGQLKNTAVKELQNIIRSFWGGRPRNVIFISMILATSLISWKIYDSNIKQSTLLMQDLPALNEKLGIIKKQKNLKGSIDDLISKAPQAAAPEKIIKTITDTAGKYHLQISSLSPARTVAHEETELTSVEIDLTSKDYKSIILFIKDIENSPYALRVLQWHGRMEEGRSGIKQTADTNIENTFIAQVEIGAIKIIHD